MTMALWDDPEDFKHLLDYTMITSSEDIGQVLTALDNSHEFALDTETTSVNWLEADLHGISFATQDKEWYVTGGAERAIMPNLNKIVSDPTKTVYMHNARYDIHILRKYGFRPVRVFDTYIAQYLIDENQRLALKTLSWKLGIDDDLPSYKDLLKQTAKQLRMKMQDVTIHMIPLNRLAPYAARDTRLTLALGKVSEKELDTAGMTDIFWNNEMPMVEVLLEMEERGFYLDQKLLEEMIEKYTLLSEQSRDKVIELTNVRNPNSTKQIAEYLYEVRNLTPKKFTKSKLPAVDVIALRRLLKRKNGEPVEGHPMNDIINTIITYRQSTKVLGTYLEPFSEQLRNGRLHTSYNATSGRDTYGTVTTRLTSSHPNLQNVPGFGLGSEIRTLFIATPGYKTVVIDHSQLELRLLAHYSRDPKMMNIFETNGDPHQMTADLIGILRKYAKNVNFGWAYGIGGRGLADTIERSGHERPNERLANEWLRGFGTAYPVAQKWKMAVVNYARKLGYIRTIDGHLRRLPDLSSKVEYDRARAERQAPNAVIQGSAAGLMRHTMIADKKQLADIYGSFMLGQVHDEIIWETPEDTINDFAHDGQKLMESVHDIFNLRVPIVADPGIGNSWGEAK